MNKIKSFLKFDKAKKILAVSMIFVVLSTVFVLPSAAADDLVIYQTISPIYFSNFSGDVSAVVSPGYATLTLYEQDNGVVLEQKTYLNNNDYYNASNNRLRTKTVDGKQVTYIQLNVICNYGSININSVNYTGSTSTSPARMDLSNLYEFVCYPVANSYDSGSTYRYYFDIILSNNDALDKAREEGYQSGYLDGFSAGYSDGTSSSVIEQARADGYNAGYIAGRNSTDSENLGQNLLGDTLSAPMDALNQFVIYKSSSGFEVTLGLVVGGAISLTLFIAFLKIFAGG